MGMHSMGAFAIWHLIILAVVLAVVLYPWSKIFRKAGYTGWLCLLIIIPLVNLLTLWWFALAQWPVEKRS